MCRYAVHPARTHWACLPCRYTSKYNCGDCTDPVPSCPLCRAKMINLGRDFTAPRRRNDNQWRKIELCVAAGLTFDSCGCGPGPRPRTLAEAKTWIAPQPWEIRRRKR